MTTKGDNEDSNLT